jgi:primosomal protein N'
MLYNLYIPKNLPFDTLSYSHNTPLNKGKVVQITIKNEEFLAVVQGISELKADQIKNLKSVGCVYDFQLSDRCMEFLEKVSFLTFNSVNMFLPLTLKPYQILLDRQIILNQKNCSSLEEGSISQKPTLDYYIELEWSLRIMVIIRSIFSSNISTQNILIISPEKNIQNREVLKLKNLLNVDDGLKTLISINDLTTTSDKKLSEQIYPSFFKNNNINNLTTPAPKINIFFGNKNSLFLDLCYIDRIIILDEANPSYISEQRLYFDTREIAYWASQIYQISLTFISTLPSVRFLELSKKGLDNIKKNSKTLQIKLLERHKRQDNFENILLELLSEESFVVSDEE